MGGVGVSKHFESKAALGLPFLRKNYMTLTVIYLILGLILILFTWGIIEKKLEKRRRLNLLQDIFSNQIEVPEIDYYEDKDGYYITVIFTFQEDYDKAIKLGLIEEFKERFKKIEPDNKYFNSDTDLIFKNRGRIRKI